MADLSLECTRCSYKFSAKAIPKKCPYCDRERSITPVKSAQDLIDETLEESVGFGRD